MWLWASHTASDLEDQSQWHFLLRKAALRTKMNLTKTKTRLVLVLTFSIWQACECAIAIPSTPHCIYCLSLRVVQFSRYVWLGGNLGTMWSWDQNRPLVCIAGISASWALWPPLYLRLISAQDRNLTDSDLFLILSLTFQTICYSRFTNWSDVNNLVFLTTQTLLSKPRESFGLRGYPCYYLKKKSFFYQVIL